MVQGNVGKTYYLVGGMDGYYMATTEDSTAALDVYLEEAQGGYYLYCMVNGVKTYINMVVSGTHVNGAYEASAATVYTYDAESKTIKADVNGTTYWFGTRNDKTYTTVGPCAVSYNGFYCQFYGASSTPELPKHEHVECPTCGLCTAEDCDGAESEKCPGHEAAVTKTVVFEFGDNGTASHVDGSDLGTSKSYTQDSYTLALTGMYKVFGPAKDAQGNSCIKLGTSSVTGTFSFTVPENVNEVVIQVAKYKAKTTKISVNGVAYTINNSSNDGAYDEIKIDTTTTKTINFETVSGGVRCMINSIAWVVTEE